MSLNPVGQKIYTCTCFLLFFSHNINKVHRNTAFAFPMPKKTCMCTKTQCLLSDEKSSEENQSFSNLKYHSKVC